MSDALISDVIKIVPELVWAAFAVIAFLALRRPIIAQFDRIQSLRMPWAEADFATNVRLVEDASAKAQAAQPATPERSKAAVSRLDHAADLLKNGRILWVDDNPEWNRSLIRLFERTGMTVDTALSTEDAIGTLRRRLYDVVITDMRRGEDKQAGVTLVNEMERRGIPTPTIVFAANFDPCQGVHPAIFGYTALVDEVVHKVIDVMERRHFGGHV